MSESHLVKNGYHLPTYSYSRSKSIFQTDIPKDISCKLLNAGVLLKSESLHEIYQPGLSWQTERDLHRHYCLILYKNFIPQKGCELEFFAK